MSRIGKLPVKIPQGVKVAIGADMVTVEGPKGKLTQEYNPLVTFKTQGDTILVTRKDDEKQTKSYHGHLSKPVEQHGLSVLARGFLRP